MRERAVHSLHAYFLRAGDVEAPIVYDVDRARDGKSFSVRRVVAIQHGQPIFNFSASFQIQRGRRRAPDAHARRAQTRRPAAASADRAGRTRQAADRSCSAGSRGVARSNSATCIRATNCNPEKRPPYQQIWFKLIDKAPDDANLHRAMLAYASDFHLIGTATLPHGISYLQNNVQMASLDHALWFHRPFRVDEWLLYSCDSPTAQGARGLTRGMIYSRDGRLVASTAQEGMIRILPDHPVP